MLSHNKVDGCPHCRTKNAGFTKVKGCSDDYHLGPPSVIAPKGTPDQIANLFWQGCKNTEESPYGAVMCFRKAIEFGLKDLSPNTEPWGTQKRISLMYEKGLLTKEIKEIADSFNVLCEGINDFHQASTQDAVQLMELTRIILVYIFTLPPAVQKLKQRVSALK